MSGMFNTSRLLSTVQNNPYHSKYQDQVGNSKIENAQHRHRYTHMYVAGDEQSRQLGMLGFHFRGGGGGGGAQ